MLKHYVTWNIKKDAKKRAVDDLILKILELKKLNEVLDLKIEKSNCKSSTKDIILLVTLLHQKDLNTYLKDPLHVKVAEEIDKVLTNRDVIDIEN